MQSGRAIGEHFRLVSGDGDAPVARADLRDANNRSSGCLASARLAGQVRCVREERLQLASGRPAR
jgi:hypothetical protein